MNNVSANYLSNVIETCVSLGCDRQALMSALPVEDISQDPLRRFEVRYLADVYQQASEFLPDPNIGLTVGSKFNTSWLNETGKVLPICSTFGEAGMMLGRYHRLTQSFARSRMRIGDDFSFVDWHTNYDDHERYKHITEAIYTGIAIGLRWLLWGKETSIEFVQFKHEAHGDSELYSGIFGCPVYFGKDRTALAFKSDLLEFPLATSNPDMKVEMCRRLDRLMLRLSNNAFLHERVQASIRVQLSDNAPNFKITADHLDMTERNLRYQLTKQNSSFRKIVDHVRREICDNEMRQKTKMSIIAQKLGFYDQSAFNHAFKKWYGIAPKEYSQA